MTAHAKCNVKCNIYFEKKFAKKYNFVYISLLSIFLRIMSSDSDNRYRSFTSNKYNEVYNNIINDTSSVSCVKM